MLKQEATYLLLVLLDHLIRQHLAVVEVEAASLYCNSGLCVNKREAQSCVKALLTPAFLTFHPVASKEIYTK